MMDNQIPTDTLNIDTLEESAQRTLRRWRMEGAQDITYNYNRFHELLNTATEYKNRGKYSLAAAHASIAIHWAVGLHCGLFCSGQLEELLLDLGKRAVPASPPSPNRPARASACKNILHVCTCIVPVGGLTRMLRRWIEQDPGNCHSVALTRQTWRNLPSDLLAAINATGGRVFRANTVPGTLVTWARRLQKFCQHANIDLVVLHTVAGDIVPIIAFADKRWCPRVLLLDHADHVFWAGAGISDVVISLRESGMRLAQSRRGIEPHRNVLLPIPLESKDRTLTRIEAKKALGFPVEQLMLLSTARPVKYRNLDQMSYADIHVSVLEKYKHAALMVVGAGTRKDWTDAIKRTKGRITTLNVLNDVSLYYQAADIYVDSFPFVSNTSLLEAAVFGTPVVSIFPYSDTGEILGADMPGLSGCLIQANTFEKYRRVLGELIEDHSRRIMIGERLQEQVRAFHTGAGWLRHLQEVYKKVDKTPVLITPVFRKDYVCQSEPDVFIRRFFGMATLDAVEEQVLTAELQVLPFRQRLRALCRLLLTINDLSGRIWCLRRSVPEWILCRLRVKQFGR